MAKAKLRKMLGDVNSPYIASLMRLIETQSKATIARWCLDYAWEHILRIYEEAYPGDGRPRAAMDAAEEWLRGNLKLPAVKKLILETHAAAREAEEKPAAQAAARTIGQAAAVIHTPTHSLGLAFYGAAAMAYSIIGTDATPEAYEEFAAAECARIESALQAIAVPDEPNPAKIDWKC